MRSLFRWPGQPATGINPRPHLVETIVILTEVFTDRRQAALEVHLTVTGLDRSIEFYRDVVGLHLATVVG